MTFPETPAYPEASQATTALVLGILGIICCQFLGIAAWIMGNNELAAIREGRRNPTNEGTATAARILGIISVVLLALGVIAMILLFLGALAVPWSTIDWNELEMS